MKQYIVDRIENGIMTIETDNGQMAHMPHSLIPEAKEGDVLTLCVNREETKKRHAKTRALMDKLFED